MLNHSIGQVMTHSPRWSDTVIHWNTEKDFQAVLLSYLRLSALPWSTHVDTAWCGCKYYTRNETTRKKLLGIRRIQHSQTSISISMATWLIITSTLSEITQLKKLFWNFQGSRLFRMQLWVKESIVKWLTSFAHH